MFIIQATGGKITPLACHLTNKVNKAEELTYLSTDNMVCIKNATESNTRFTWLGFLRCYENKQEQSYDLSAMPKEPRY
jgi:hypothetical protein